MSNKNALYSEQTIVQYVVKKGLSTFKFLNAMWSLKTSQVGEPEGEGEGEGKDWAG